MLKLINLCYELAGLYITVPEGYEVESILEKYFSDNALMIKHADKDYTIVYYVEDDCPATKANIIDTQKRLLGKVYPIYEITVNGLFGYQTTYDTKKQQCFEARFPLKKTDTGNTEFVFMIFTVNNDIDEIKASDDFQKLLNGIRKKED